MWAEKLPNGHYKFTDRFVDPVTGQNKKVSVTLEKNTAQTRRLAAEILRTKMYSPSPSSLTFSDLCTLYLNDQKAEIKASTLGRNTGALNTLKSILGENTQAERLTAGYIRKALLDTGKEPGTMNELLKRLKAMLRWAYRNDYISDIRYLDKLEPFHDIPKSQKVEDKYLEAEELTAILDSMNITLWKNVTMFLALSGLRFGECAALTRSDVDLSAREINVDKNYDYINHLTTSPKNHSSIRKVFIQDELYDLCADILYEDNIIDISDLLFTQQGHHIHYDAYRQYLEDHSQEAIGRRITPHTLRHTHASLMMEQGMDVDSIASRLGHSTSKVTREIYLHVTKRLEEKRNEQIKDIRIIG